MIAQNGHAKTVLSVATLGLCLWVQAATAQEAPPIAPGPDGIIVAFGERDQRYEDFARTGGQVRDLLEIRLTDRACWEAGEVVSDAWYSASRSFLTSAI